MSRWLCWLFLLAITHLQAKPLALTDAQRDYLQTKKSLRYCIDPKAHQAQDFLDKLKGWQATGSVKQADWDAALTRLETLKNVVMNPYSHPSAPNIPKQEVEQAIDAVDQFLNLVVKR